jgi:hypothetical protein
LHMKPSTTNYTIHAPELRGSARPLENSCVRVKKPFPHVVIRH